MHYKEETGCRSSTEKRSQEVKDDLCRKIETLRQQEAHSKLSVVLIGTHAASATYVRNKERACAAIGMKRYDACGNDHAGELLAQSNSSTRIYGRWDPGAVPLPRQIDERKVLNAIDPGRCRRLSPVNIGRLLIGEPASVPLHAQRDHPHAGSDRAGRSQRQAPSSSAAATSSVNRSLCCC
ncbi:MAG: tetrahydrofolate dehydrogenase/cyclohydrolase catalytic domain-containing protein [Merdibacter sp.]